VKAKFFISQSQCRPIMYCERQLFYYKVNVGLFFIVEAKFYITKSCFVKVNCFTKSMFAYLILWKPNWVLAYLILLFYILKAKLLHYKVNVGLSHIVKDNVFINKSMLTFFILWKLDFYLTKSMLASLVLWMQNIILRRQCWQWSMWKPNFI
jgi:hypothetical protein